MIRSLITSLLVALPLMAEPVLVSKFSAKIVPERVAVIALPERGTITDLADPTGRLEAGTIIAIANKERTATEREDMELQLERDRLTKRDEIQKLQLQRRQVEFYLSLSASERRYNSDFTPDKIPTADTLQDIDARISLLERELRTLERRRRDEFENKHGPLTLRMPFSGRLQYSFPLPENLAEPFEYTDNSRPFATACDDSAFYITISVGESDLALLDEHRFSATVNLPGGRRLNGTYSHRRVERSSNGGDMLVYYFRLPETAHETAFSMLGSNSTAQLTYETGTDVLRVKKAELAATPEAATCENWAELISLLYPQHSILLIGQREIVLVPNAE